MTEKEMRFVKSKKTISPVKENLIAQQSRRILLIRQFNLMRKYFRTKKVHTAFNHNLDEILECRLKSNMKIV